MDMIQHGGALDLAISRYGGEPSGWLDLSTGISPKPWPVKEVESETWSRLPDSDALQRLTAAARAYYHVPSRAIIVAAPGTQALIGMLPRLFGGPACILRPELGTYGEHERCLALAGHRIVHEQRPSAVRPDCRYCVLVHPNNPCGEYWAPQSIHAMAATVDPGLVVIDEAFCDLLPDASFIPGMTDNMVVLRSFGKFFGLAGLRLGFAICSPKVGERLSAALGPWALSGPALAIGAAALKDDAWIAAHRAWLVEQSLRLAEILESKGMPVVGRHPLFVLSRHVKAERIADELAHRHILVRSFQDRPELLRFGLPGDEQALKRLDQALDELRQGGVLDAG